MTILRPIDADVGVFDPFAGPAIAASVPSTGPQREIWTATQMGDDASLAFNESVSIRLLGEVDVAALQAGIRDLVDRHDALRATFTSDGLSVLIAPAGGEVKVTSVDWSELPPSERSTMLRALTAGVVDEPFDLRVGPLVRFVLARVATTEHVLVITAHHIICDGWSFGVIASELAQLYTARYRGTPLSLSPADQFSDYAVAQLDAEARDARATAEQYWTAQFADLPAVLDLPTDHQRPTLRTYSSAREDRRLDPQLVERVRQTGKRVGASLFATLFGSIAVLLRRLSGQRDLVVGIAAAGQPSAGVPSLVGHLVTVLPVRVRSDDRVTVRGLLEQTRRTVIEAYEHQHLTFGSLLERLPMSRDPGRPPLVSVVFNLDRAIGPAAMSFDGVQAHLTSNPRHAENFELFVNAVEDDSSIALECQYNSDLFNRETIRAWLEAYERLLDAVTQDLDAEVATLPLVTPEERESLACGPALPGPVPVSDLEEARRPAQLVHHLVERQAALTPSAIAIEHEDQRITYEALNARANQLARYLRRQGIRRGVLVGLHIERSIDMIVALLGVLKSGGGYVPLDPAYPIDRLRFMARDSAMASLIVGAASSANGLDVAGIVSLERDSNAIAAEADANLDDASGDEAADSPAYVIYTSGSTGVPKGVVVPHRSVVNLLRSVRERPGLDERDVALAITTLSFDIAVSEVILPLTVGARVVVASRDVASDGLRLARLIADAGITFIDATPSTYRLLLEAGWQGDRRLRLICTGEALPRELAEALLGRCGELWNGYGPTEATVWATFWQVPQRVERVWIGRPIANTRVYVLDENRQPVPRGARGELFIAGAGVTTGYLKRPELTAERFVVDPFASRPGARMYRTGDVVRFLADGTIEYYGRNDDQIKVRGYRIEPGEIEDALVHHPGIAQAAVAVINSGVAGPQLVAYVVERPASRPSDAELRGHLKGTLPDYMVPQRIVRLPSLPQTPSGKLDRHRLPAPTDEPTDEGTFVEPRTATEQLLSDLWSSALGLRRVSVQDDFFALGGHSLLAAQILARIRREYGIEMSFRKVFEAPTIEQFATLVDEQRAGPATAPRAKPIESRADRSQAPLSVWQTRVWSLEELEPSRRPTHNHPSSFRLAGALDVEVLQSAINDFVARHEVMRASFHLVDGVRVQRIAPAAAMPLARVDVSHLDGAERDQALRQVLLDEQERPIDRTSAPLARVALVRLAPDDHLLTIVAHGLVWDGWSFDLFIRDVAELYAARSTARAPSLPELPVSYGDWAAWQPEWLAGAAMTRDATWWRAQLSGDLPVLELPTDYERPAVSVHRGGFVQRMLNREELNALHALATAHDATLFMVLLTAYAVLLHRLTGQSDLLIGCPMRARTLVETENVVGPFVNTVALRIQVQADMCASQLLAAVRTNSLEAFGRQETPFELLGSKPPILRALFSMQDARTRPVAMADIDVKGMAVPQPYAADDVMLWTMETKTGLLAALNYSGELFTPWTAEQLVLRFISLLRSIVRDSRQSISCLDVLSDDERPLVLDERNATNDANPAVLLDRVAAHAASHPDGTALECDNTRVSYGELWERAGGIAESLYALCGTRPPGAAIVHSTGIARVVATLGAMRAGAAVVLASSADPPAYRDTLLRRVQDKGAVVVLTGAEQPWTGPRIVPALELDAYGMPETAREATLRTVPDPRAPALLLHGPDGVGDVATVPVSHRDLASQLHCAATRLDANASDVVLSCIPVGADAEALAMVLPLACGARLLVTSEEHNADPEIIADLLGRGDVTLGVVPDPLARELATLEWRSGPGTRLVVVGAPMSGAELRPLRSRATRVFTAYGHREQAVWASVYEVPTEAEDDTRTLIGEPLGTTAMYVLDAHLQPAPVGVPGDLFLADPMDDRLARGSDASSRSRQLQVVIGGRKVQLYQTRDRARRLMHGTLEMLATDDERAWVDGRRIDLGAIEGALRAHPAIEAAAAAAQPDSMGVPRLVAYVMLRQGSPATDTELRAAARATLPRWMTPTRFVEVESLPVDQHGAVERRRLPNPYSAVSPTPEMVLPRTSEERIVAAMWQEMLGVEKVTVSDNFFMLGGFSLLCFRFIDRVHREVGVSLNPRIILLGTLEQVAAQLRITAANGAALAVPSGDVRTPREAQ